MNRRALIASLLSAAAVLVARPGPASAEWRRDNKEECARIDDRLRAIEAERRAGYTPKKGRRLQAQREKLEGRRREKCR